MDIRKLQRQCPQCGDRFQLYTGRRGKPATFCSPACRKAFVILDRARGELVMALAQVWRTGKRGSTPDRKYAFATLCAALDSFNTEDRAKGRKPDLVVRHKRSIHWRLGD